jgi:TolB-like protein
MLRFRTLGGAAVEGQTGPIGGAAAQRKSLALLALLALAGDRGISRDKLLAYLWPETDPDRAGHRLTQALYALRRDLRLDALFLGSAELRLNAELMGSDVAEFVAARHAGQLERAVALYGGPFLDGFFLGGAPEFERWVDNERAGLARDYAEALETLAAEAVARGDLGHAAEWWRRLADHDPLSSRATVHLMSALAAAGRRADAIVRASAYQELIQRELDAAPNPAVLALARQLRQAAPPGAELSVAVLPFTNLSSLPANDFFAEGLVEELMSGLARLEGVRVAARTSGNAFRATELDAREIARRLDVSALIEGTVRQSDERVRLTVHLIDATDGCHLWSERYERRLTNPFEVQDELSRLILDGVEASLAGLRTRGPARPG